MPGNALKKKCDGLSGEKVHTFEGIPVHGSSKVLDDPASVAKMDRN